MVEEKVIILLLEDCILIQGQTDRYGKNITCTIIFTFSGGTNNKMSLQISRIKGIPIRLHFTLIVVFFLITWTLATNFMPQRNSPNVLDSINYWIMGATGALILFVSVLLHELAHSLVAIKYGLKVRQIVLFIFGGVSDIEEEEKITKDFRKEFKIAVVGPITSFGIAATLGSIWWVIFLQVNIEIVGRISDPNIAIPLMAEGILFYGAIANLLLGAFNLIPAFPLDGGRILRAALVGWKKDYIQATRIAVKLGIWISYGFMGAGFLIVLGGSFTGGIWLILIGWFLNNGAQSYLYQSEMSSTLSATSLKDIMNTNIIFIEQGTKVDEALSGYFHLYMKSAFPVLRTKNNSTDNLLVHHFFVGMVTLKQALDISEEKRHQISVEDIMTPRDRLIVMETNRKADEALMQMTQRRMGKVFVCNKEGQLIGLITKTDIMNVVDERMEFKETLAK